MPYVENGFFAFAGKSVACELEYFKGSACRNLSYLITFTRLLPISLGAHFCVEIIEGEIIGLLLRKMLC